MLREMQELLDLIKMALHGNHGSYDADGSIDYDLVFRIAVNNSVANTVADLICKGNGFSDEIKNKFLQQKTIVVAHHVVSDRALKELYDKLDDAHISSIFLKGTILRRIYSNPILRAMSDIDVYAEKEDMDRIYTLMRDLKYETGVIGRGNHYEYLRDRFVKIEFHPEIVSIDSEYGQMVFQKIYPKEVAISSKMDIWNHTAPIDGHTFAKQLIPEYHYLYVIMHMMNHFLTAGTGIRSLMDVWLMNKNYADSWDRKLIENLLSDFGMTTFEQFALALADKWFDLSDLSYCPKDVDQDRLMGFEDFILHSGTYGTIENHINKQMGFRTGTSSKLRYLVSRFFLPYKIMKECYPCLRKVPILLPVLWIHHAFDGIIKRRKTLMKKMKTITSANLEKAEKQKRIIDFITDCK